MPGFGCKSEPDGRSRHYPIATTIEGLINGVVVRFSRVSAHGQAPDLGLWDNPLRTTPLYPD